MPSAEHSRRIYDKLQDIPIRHRLRDIELWLKDHFPTAHPVVVRVERLARVDGIPVHGECYMGSHRRLRIRVHKDQTRDSAIETLLHEYAHAVVWPTAFAERHRRAHGDHSDIYWAAYGDIYRQFYDGTGWKMSSGLK